MAYWLVKSEPSTYSWDQLVKDKQTSWTGVRNYAARIHLKAMKKGEEVLFYHSNAEPPAVVGSAEVVKTAYPDDTQFDRRSHHFDPASTREQPRWDMVDLKYKEKIFALERGPNILHQIKKHGLIGKPTDIAERINEYLKAGVTQFLLAFQDPFDKNSLGSFNDVMKAIK